MCFQTHVILKPPKTGRPTPDLGYFKIMHPVRLDFLITEIKCIKGILEL
jgi:hypothetical protein